MKIFKSIIIILLFLQICFAQDKSAHFALYLKPGISFISTNNSTLNSINNDAFEFGGGLGLLIKNVQIFGEYTKISKELFSKLDDTKSSFVLSSTRLGIINLTPINDDFNLRILAGMSMNSSNLFSGSTIGYFTGLGIENAIISNKIYSFIDLQYDLIDCTEDHCNGNLGGTKFFFGIKYIFTK